jgi:hypothetical protein
VVAATDFLFSSSVRFFLAATVAAAFLSSASCRLCSASAAFCSAISSRFLSAAAACSAAAVFLASACSRPASAAGKADWESGLGLGDPKVGSEIPKLSPAAFSSRKYL